MRGAFITFEGPDGGGKTTQVRLLQEYLTGKGYKVFCTREPGGTQIGDTIREILLNPKYDMMSATTETLLYMAARAQHVVEKILPALEQGKVVISDRYADSTLVYQGVARKLSAGELQRLNSFATGNLAPDITILLDGMPDILFTRTARRGQVDRIEQEGLAFQERVRDGFLTLARQEPQRIKIVSALSAMTEVHQQIVNIIREFLDRRGSCED